MSRTSRNTGLGKRIASLAGATALLLAGGVATAGQAAAGASCPSGYHCVFQGSVGSIGHKSFFNSDTDFTNDYWEDTGGPVNDQVMAASNSSNGGYESHYYRDVNYGGGLLFCVNPGSQVNWDQLDWTQRNQASSLRLRPTTTIPCF
ncbi:peptidase inhibitor family I36 protein [Streptomyces laurentii]|uniref:peptidase inhibitor family I36 protein n=1 Tax=Streptomyces laurentii TaxID=39478 RepID=UPI003688B153